MKTTQETTVKNYITTHGTKKEAESLLKTLQRYVSDVEFEVATPHFQQRYTVWRVLMVTEKEMDQNGRMVKLRESKKYAALFLAGYKAGKENGE